MKNHLLLLLFCLPLFVGMGVPSIWDANEAFYVETPREMVRSGDWLSPSFNDAPRLNKPPLSYWVVAVFYKIFGASVWTQRLAMALTAALCVLLVHRLGRMLFDPTIGLWAAAIFATSIRFLIVARRLFIDVLLLACLLAVLLCFVTWLRRENRWAPLLMGFFVGCGFLTKGPAVAIGLLPLAAYLIWQGDWRRLKPGLWSLAALIAAATSLSWFLALGFSQGWQPVINFFLVENLSRYSGGDFGPQRGVFYYLGVFMLDFEPWSPLFVLALIANLVKKLGFGGGAPRATAAAIRPALLTGLWIASFMLIFSFSGNKQEYYILPIYPATALWTAVFLRAQGDRIATRIAAAFPNALAALVLFLTARVIVGQEGVLWIVPPLLVAGVCALQLAARHRWAPACLAIFYAAAFGLYLEPLESYRPTAPLSRRIVQETAQRPEAQVGYFRFTAPSMVYYLDRPILEIYDVQEALDRFESERPVYLIMKAGDHDLLQARSRQTLRIVEERPKLYTTARNFGQLIRSGPGEEATWTTPVYLVTNR